MGSRVFSKCDESNQVRSAVTRDVAEYLKNQFEVVLLGQFVEFPADSCTEIKQVYLQPLPGLYWIAQNGTTPIQFFCDF